MKGQDISQRQNLSGKYFSDGMSELLRIEKRKTVRQNAQNCRTVFVLGYVFNLL